MSPLSQAGGQHESPSLKSLFLVNETSLFIYLIIVICTMYIDNYSDDVPT